jgi:hypothetical protein
MTSFLDLDLEDLEEKLTEIINKHALDRLDDIEEKLEIIAHDQRDEK